MNTYLILDAHNLVYRVFFAEDNEDAELTASICFDRALASLNKYYKQYNVNDVVVAFDSPNSWRKIYTKDNKDCVTHKVYKGHRRENLTERKQRQLNDLDNYLNELSDLFQNKTGLIVLKAKYLEADDLIAGFVQKHPDDKHIIISSDKDFIQLLGNGNVSLLDPLTGKPRDLAEWDHDANYFIFQKCFRGDANDNVQSSYPRVRETKIKLAYTDKFTRTNLMNHTFIVEYLDSTGTLKQKNYKTQDLFEENSLLMDLTKQPDYIRELIYQAIDHAISNRGKFNYFEFLKFCGKRDLPNIISNIDRYVALLSGKGKCV